MNDGNNGTGCITSPTFKALRKASETMEQGSKIPNCHSSGEIYQRFEKSLVAIEIKLWHLSRTGR